MTMRIGTHVRWRNGTGTILAICDGWAWIRTSLGGFATVPLSALEAV